MLESTQEYWNRVHQSATVKRIALDLSCFTHAIFLRGRQGFQMRARVTYQTDKEALIPPVRDGTAD